MNLTIWSISGLELFDNISYIHSQTHLILLHYIFNTSKIHFSPYSYISIIIQ